MSQTIKRITIGKYNISEKNPKTASPLSDDSPISLSRFTISNEKRIRKMIFDEILKTVLFPSETLVDIIKRIR
ncbi:MAG: hypothetical protein J6Y69_09275 [Treponema sp.]|nr:hypothetical protein [Treponema sp.]